MDTVLQAFDRFGFYFFQMLLSFLWQSSLVLLPVLLALRIFRKSIPALRNSIAISGILALPAVIILSWLINVLAVPSSPIPVMPEYASENAKANSSRNLMRFKMTSTGKYHGSASREFTAGENANNRAPGGEVADSVQTSANPLEYPWACGLAIYGIIQAFLLFKFLREWIIVRWWIGQARPITSLAVCRVFWEAAHELELRTGQFELVESRMLKSPVTAGAFFSRVILPKDFNETCDPDNMKTVAYHELAHVRRKDPLVFSAIAFARTVLFFHPLVLLVAHEFSLIAEQDCDEIAIINSGMSRRSYAKSLASIAERLTAISRRPMQALGIFFGGSVLIQRFESILARRKNFNRNRMYIPVTAVACIAVPLAIAVSLPLAEQDPGSQRSIPLPSGITLENAFPGVENTAYAIPLRNIRIDGSLDDWPSGVIRYPIRNNAQLKGATDIDGTNLGLSADLSPSMMVGYNEEEGLLYVGVTVRDDRMVTVRNPEEADPKLTDACEVYVAGQNQPESPRLAGMPVAAWDMPSQMYVMCPENGAYDLSAWLHDPPYTPALFHGNIRNTGSACACVRKDRITTYEWAVRVYDRYPESPIELSTGTVIRFDVAIADRDSANDNPAWITWGPCTGRKCSDPSRLGNLVLAKRYADLSVVSGIVARGSDSYSSANLGIYRGTECAMTVTTDKDGRFHTVLPPGNYTVRIQDPKAHEHFYMDRIAVTPGSLVTANLRVSLNGFARLGYEYTALFSSFKKRIEGSGVARFAFSFEAEQIN